MKNINEYLYKKEFRKNNDGILFIINPDKMLDFINDASSELMAVKNDEERKTVMIKIISYFKTIVRYDVNHSDYSKPFGTFIYSDSKKMINKKILLQDFVLYLGNIFGKLHMEMKRCNIPFTLLNVPKSIIDYNELYKRALLEYINELKIIEEERINYGKIKANDYINIDTLEVEKIIGDEIPKDVKLPVVGEYVYGTPYMLMVLIEKFLCDGVRSKLLNKLIVIMKEKIKNKEIYLEEKEIKFLNLLTTNEVIYFSENPYPKIYNLFVKYNIIEENDNYKYILTKKLNNKVITLGELLRIPLIKDIINKEYLYLLNLIFNSDKINLRNEMMHGNSEYNYFSINFSSILLQLFWDIKDCIIYI